MTQRSGETIFAVATGARRAAIAIIRVSGPDASTAAVRLAGRIPAPREATFARLRDPDSGETLDEALVLRFEAARSETGEDGVEFHCHGSPAVLTAILAVLARQPGFRPAEPGEFARRAFLNGKIDLTQLEALADLIDAETEMQRRSAQRIASGALRAMVEPLRANLIEASASVEASIDFADEIDADDSAAASMAGAIGDACRLIRSALESAKGAERVRDGVQIVIAGPPNAGKSSLLNALARREAAIVSAIAGTTRDPVEVHLDLGGCPVTLIDTAGLRDTTEPIEVIGIQRARERLADADLVLWLDPDWGREAVPSANEAGAVWLLRSKADLLPSENARDPKGAWMPLSVVSAGSLDPLVDRLAAFAADSLATVGTALLTRERHRLCFQSALEALEAAQVPGLPPELRAEEIRRASFQLDRLIGKVDVEDVLGAIFSRFCIGK